MTPSGAPLPTNSDFTMVRRVRQGKRCANQSEGFRLPWCPAMGDDNRRPRRAVPKDEARRIAVDIAKLLETLWKVEGW